MTTGFKLTMGCSFPLTTGFKCLLGRVQKRTPPLPTATDFQTDQNANKGFQQQPMCQNPLFSAVFPIFCSFPLYQLSGLHFSIFVERCRIFRNRFLLCRFVKSCIFRNRYPLDKFLYQLSGLHFRKMHRVGVPVTFRIVL